MPDDTVTETAPEPTEVRVDLDAIFAARFKEKKEALPLGVSLTLFGKEYHLVETNIVTALKSLNLEKNPGGLLELIERSFMPGEGADLIAELEAIGGLDGELLGELYGQIIEAQSKGRPTKRSSNSRRTRSTARRSQS